jgi:hypothetical protein
MARLLSVNVGHPREIAWRGKTVYTSVWKAPVQGRRLVRRLNVDGDAQGDLHGHGGEQRAVFVNQMDSYHYWERELKRSDFTFGQFAAGVGGADDLLGRAEQPLDGGELLPGALVLDALVLDEYTCEPFACELGDGAVVVTSRMTGTFPGSPVNLRFFFLLESDKIASLEIVP